MDNLTKCSNCWKPTPVCVCEGLVKQPNALPVLILQHPQEARNALSTTRLLFLSLASCTHQVGLSWPSLSAALGRPAKGSEWAVLYVGTQKSVAPGALKAPVTLVDKSGKPLPLKRPSGIVLLDGNWSQSKTLWWRNAWLLKLQRLVLNPTEPSLYGALRKEPRKGLVSTLEAAALCLDAFGEKPQVKTALLGAFSKQIEAWQRPS